MTETDQTASGDMMRRANDIARRLAAASESAHLTPEERTRCRAAARGFDSSLDALEAFVAKTERAITARAEKPPVAA